MSEALIRQQIYAILAAVPNVGVVHDYERWTADWAKFLELFKDPAGGRILGWEITRVSYSSIKLSKIQEQVTHEFKIQGYMGMKDADRTDVLFNAIIDGAIAPAFRGNHDLNGACSETGALRAETIDNRSFGSVLCHYADLRLTATEIVRAV